MANGKRSATPAEKRALETAAVQLSAETAAIPHITEFEDLVDVLPDLAAEYRQAHQDEIAAKARKAELAPQLDALLDAVGQRAIRGDTWAVTKVAGARREKIVPEKLLAQGVTMDQIEAATEKTQDKGYIQVREIK